MCWLTGAACVYEAVYVWWVCGEGMSVLGAMRVHVCECVCMCGGVVYVL